MGLQLFTFFLGLLLLLGWGTTQTPVSSEKTSTEEEQWPKLVILNNLTFSCNLKMLGSNASSTSVHTLRPSDLKFVASIGMKEILPAQSTVSVMEKLNRIEEVFQEVSLGVGTVLSDIIGYFNPAILRSECTPRRNVTPWPGAEHLCTQATELVRSMKENPELDFENEWKLINVFIHHAHKCYLCPVARQQSFVTSALNNLAKTLDYLHQEVPRAFLNLVDLTEVLEFSALSEMETQGSDNTESCGCSEETLLPKDVAWWAYQRDPITVARGCSEGTGVEFQGKIPKNFQEAWERVLASSKYNQEDSFALVFQPFFYETDQSPLLKEQSLQDLALMGMHLWNIMLEPAGQKGRPYRAREKRLVKCPQKEHPYLFTYGNSNYQPWLPKNYVALKVLEASTPNFTSSITWPSSTQTTPTNSSTSTLTIPTTSSDSTLTIPTTSSDSTLTITTTSSDSTLTIPTTSSDSTLTIPTTSSNSTLTIPTTSSNSTLTTLTTSSNSILTTPSTSSSSTSTTLITSSSSTSTTLNTSSSSTLTTPITSSNSILTTLSTSFSSISTTLNTSSSSTSTTLNTSSSSTSTTPITSSNSILTTLSTSFSSISTTLNTSSSSTSTTLNTSSSSTSTTPITSSNSILTTLSTSFSSISTTLNTSSSSTLTILTTSSSSTSNTVSTFSSSTLTTLTASSSVQPEGSIGICPVRAPSSSNPQSVHSLRPADIKVVAAIGDAFTAGSGAKSKFRYISDVFTEYRGVSWSIGGDGNLKTVVTLPNILRQFNSKLKGFSTGSGNQNSDGAKLNQAVVGALSRDMPNQVREVIRKMKRNKKIDYENDWKLLTVFVGVTDLCLACTQKPPLTPEGFRRNVQVTLDILHAEVPRMFVNMVLPLDITGLKDVGWRKTNKPCPLLYQKKSCPCVFQFEDDWETYDEAVEESNKYQELIKDLLETGRYDTREDFTVVLQPFLEQMSIPLAKTGLIDVSYLAPDCFLFSKKTHGKAASALWKNMLEPVGQKTKKHTFESKIVFACPTELQPFLFTSKNSIKNYGSKVFCVDTFPSFVTPRTVYTLKPADIEIVAAMGDFVIAGTGIGAEPGKVQDLATEYRGLSFSAGGDNNLTKVTTLPNIFRIFNRNLKGFAVSTGDAQSQNSGLNQAVSSAKAKDLLRQAQTLVEIMEHDKKIDFINDWKIITVMIGNNDLCDFCQDVNKHSGDQFLYHVRNGLDYLHAEVPRALVNLVDFIDPYVQRQVFMTNPDVCSLNQSSVSCNCILSPKMSFSELLNVENMARIYKNNLYNLVASGRYNSRDDFTVVLQPSFSKIQIPVLKNGSLDTSFFAPDCFHPNQKFHTQLARALWSNMLQPLGSKKDFLNVGYPVTLGCPEDHQDFSPFLRTVHRSKYKYLPLVEQNWGSDFICSHTKPSHNIPTSVHKLRPADIRVVAALGDWITTALGARPDNQKEILSWNGLSWSIGGDKTLDKQTTLPNILRKFNPEIVGYSGGTWRELTGLNVAQEEARARHLPTQAMNLIKQMRSNPKINMSSDWKLITIFIGINDLCDFCTNQDPKITENIIQNITVTLDIFFKELSSVFINLVEIMQLFPMYQNQGGKCANSTVPRIHCPCFTDSKESFQKDKLEKLNMELQSAIFNLSLNPLYRTRKDFVVVAQPFFRNSVFPRNKKGEIDSTFFSEDCFHFSSRGHDEMAIALWNNMLEPVGHKSTYHDFEKNRRKLKCPSTVHPYLFTQANSILGAKAQLLFRVALALFFLPLLLFLIVKLLKWLGNKRFPKRVQPEEPETSTMDSEVREEETIVSGEVAETKA